MALYLNLLSRNGAAAPYFLETVTVRLAAFSSRATCVFSRKRAKGHSDDFKRTLNMKCMVSIREATVQGKDNF